jgi:hypothetical protein
MNKKFVHGGSAPGHALLFRWTVSYSIRKSWSMAENKPGCREPAPLPPPAFGLALRAGPLLVTASQAAAWRHRSLLCRPGRCRPGACRHG